MKWIVNIFVLSVLLLVSCNSGDIPTSLTTPLLIKSASLDTEVISSRSVTQVTSGNIGVFLTGTDYTSVNNCNYTYNTVNSSWGSLTPIYLGGKNANICAYYPYSNSYNNISIPLVSKVYAVTSDLSYATNQVKNGASANSSIIFSMKRAYARLKIMLKKDTSYPGQGNVSGLVIKNLRGIATLNIGTGSYSTTAGLSGNTISSNTSKTATTTAANYEEYLLIPCTPASTGMQIELTVDSKTMTTIIPTNSYKPVAGEYKSITLNLEGTELNVIGVNVEVWPSASNLGEYSVK